MKKLTVFFFLLLLSFSDNVTSLLIGKTEYKILYTDNESTVATVVSLHNNEDTAIKATKGLPTKYKLNILELQNSGERNLKFAMGNNSYQIDPNRIFTKAGVQLTLQEQNKDIKKIPKEVTKEVRRFGKELISLIKKRKKGDYIIAAHNNYEGFENKGAVSILNYANFRSESNKDIEDVAIFEKNDLDDFVLVTEKEDFDFFKTKKVNVALYKKQVTDDGSLSVYCIQNKIPYINIEAQHDGKTGHLDEQKKLLELTYELLTVKRQYH